MTRTPVTSDRDTRVHGSAAAGDASDPATAATLAWLESEFPGWAVSTVPAGTSTRDRRELWIARRDGHHPQSELSAAKLHSRLSDYLGREARKRALAN